MSLPNLSPFNQRFQYLVRASPEAPVFYSIVLSSFARWHCEIVIKHLTPNSDSEGAQEFGTAAEEDGDISPAGLEPSSNSRNDGKGNASSNSNSDSDSNYMGTDACL